MSTVVCHICSAHASNDFAIVTCSSQFPFLFIFWLSQRLLRLDLCFSRACFSRVNQALPSISTSSWLSVFSRSSCPPNCPVRPRARPTASISSIKMMHGAFLRAWENMSLTRAGPTPTNISRNSEPEMLRNGTCASPATALANSVLPVPGGPDRMAP